MPSYLLCFFRCQNGYVQISHRQAVFCEIFQIGSRSWTICSKNCNRRWNSAFPVCSKRQHLIKAVATKRWKWPLQSKIGLTKNWCWDNRFWEMFNAFSFWFFFPLKRQRVILSAHQERFLRNLDELMLKNTQESFLRYLSTMTRPLVVAFIKQGLFCESVDGKSLVTHLKPDLLPSDFVFPSPKKSFTVTYFSSVKG